MSRIYGIVLLPVIAVFILLRTVFAADAWQDVYERKTYQSGGQTLLYRLMKPEKIERGKSYPLVLFLHGAGHRGTDNAAQLCSTDVFAQQENRKKYPSFVLVPQCPSMCRWVEVDWGLPAHTMPETPSVPQDRRFVGFDAYRKAIDCLRPGDVAMLTGYSAFRPMQLEYAVEKGVNVFMEKSFAPDRARSAAADQGGRGGQGEEPQNRRRTATPPFGEPPGTDQAHPRRRDGPNPTHSRVPDAAPRSDAQAAGQREGAALATPQLRAILLGLRRRCSPR